MALRIRPRTVLSMLLLVMHAEAFADQNDVFIFDNGDQLTGEFRSLQRGRVDLNTYGASTINLHWEKISFVTIRCLGSELKHAF